MKILLNCGLILFFTLSAQLSYPQDLVSSYHPKNKTEKLILQKIMLLAEVKEWYITAKKSEPDIIIGTPNSASKYYSFQVGLSNLDMFRTAYWLYVDPKTFEIFYWNELNDSDHPNITLRQWRYWRTKPGFKKPHVFKHGKLVVLKDDKTKGGHF